MSQYGEGNTLPRHNATVEQVADALGLTRFSGATSREWTHILNGLFFQGGRSASVPGNTTTANIPFNAGFPQQVLGVFLTPIIAAPGVEPSFGVNVVDVNNFTITNDSPNAMEFYWFAIGV